MSGDNIKPVVIPYSKLIDANSNLNAEIEEGFGYSGLNLVIVSGIPNILELREKLLPLGTTLVNLSDEAKCNIESAETLYSVGWSHGKEKLKEGQFDVNKGSMYANPQYDEPISPDNAELIKKYYQDYHPNIWPKEDLPQLEDAFKNFGRLMVSIGEHLARHCDNYVHSKLGDVYQKGLLESLVKGSRTAKGRLLHYFPVETDVERSYDSWCSWHNDHSALTALSSAYFTTLDNPNVEVPSLEADSGLYTLTHTGKTVKVGIPKDCLAFQIGETSQVLTGAVLRATPHAVRAPKYPESKTVQRDTFAVFMQPNHDLPMTPPKGVADADVAVGKWRPGQTYSEFSKGTVEGYYDIKN